MSRVKKVEEAVIDFPVFFNIFFVGKCDAVKVSFSMLSEEILAGLSEIQVRIIEAGVIILFLGGWGLSVHARSVDWLVAAWVYTRIIVVWCWSWKYEIYRYFIENALADSAKIGS